MLSSRAAAVVVVVQAAELETAAAEAAGFYRERLYLLRELFMQLQLAAAVQGAVRLLALLAQMEQIRLHFLLLLWVAAVVDHIVLETQKQVAAVAEVWGLVTIPVPQAQRDKVMPVVTVVQAAETGVAVVVAVLLVLALPERLQLAEQVVLQHL